MQNDGQNESELEKRAGRGFTGIFKVVAPDQIPHHDFALILFVPDNVSQAVENIRRRYDPATKVAIQPHITIKRPARLQEPPHLDVMQTSLTQAFGQLQPFVVRLSGYDVFRNVGRNVVFLKVADESPLRRLHITALNALAAVYPDGAADQYEGDKYHPHVTIGNELSGLELAVLEHELTTSNLQLDFEFEARQIALLTQSPGQPWRTVADIKLGV